jgi:hypothetical protein
MSCSKLSTKSATKAGGSQKSPRKLDFVISGDFLSGRSDKSLDLSCESEEGDSFNEKNVIGDREMGLIRELEVLNASEIQNDSKSVSMTNEMNEEGKGGEEGWSRKLVLESSQIKQKWWCEGCIIGEDKGFQICGLI